MHTETPTSPTAPVPREPFSAKHDTARKMLRVVIGSCFLVGITVAWLGSRPAASKTRRRPTVRALRTPTDTR